MSTDLTRPDRDQAIRHHLRAIEALLDGEGSGEANDDSPKLLTVPKYAELCDVDERTVWRWIKKRRVEVHRNPGGGNTFVVVPPDECRKLP